MIKKIATATVMLAALAALPATMSAQDFDRGRDRDRDRREAREYRERHERDRVVYERRFARGYYDRSGCWHRY
jgi:hypothetical protein